MLEGWGLRSSLWRRKSRKMTHSQSSLSPAGQLLVRASSEALHLPHWLSPTLPCRPAPPNMLSSVVVSHGWQIGRGWPHPLSSPVEMPNVKQMHGTEAPPLLANRHSEASSGCLPCPSDRQKWVPPTAHQQQLCLSHSREPGTGEQGLCTAEHHRMHTT